eukprot:204654_1
MWSTLCLVSLAFAATTSTPSIVSKYTTQNGNTFIKLSERVKGYEADSICKDLGSNSFQSCSGCTAPNQNGFYDEQDSADVGTTEMNRIRPWLGDSRFWVGTTERKCDCWFGCSDENIFGCEYDCIYGQTQTRPRSFKVEYYGWRACSGYTSYYGDDTILCYN